MVVCRIYLDHNRNRMLRTLCDRKMEGFVSKVEDHTSDHCSFYIEEVVWVTRRSALLLIYRE